MKKLTIYIITLTIVFIILPINYVLAIGISRKGIKAGLNIANYNSDYQFDYKIGFCAGGFITLDINNIISIQPEILYTMKGAKSENVLLSESSPEPIGTYWQHDYLNYLEFPVLIKLRLTNKNYVNYSLFYGPALSIKLSSKYKTDEPSIGNGDIDNAKTTDYSMVIGGGLDFNISNFLLTFDIRYVLGFKKWPQRIDIKNNVFSFLFGCSF